jgi:hypothetical protein
MSKYKIGEEVMIAPDIQDTQKYPNKAPMLSGAMRNMGGQVGTISRVFKNQRYKVTGTDAWTWHEDWLVDPHMNADDAFEAFLTGRIPEDVYKKYTKEDE